MAILFCIIIIILLIITLGRINGKLKKHKHFIKTEQGIKLTKEAILLSNKKLKELQESLAKIEEQVSVKNLCSILFIKENMN